MSLRRRDRLAIPWVCVCCFLPCILVAQQPAPQPPKKNPFEAIPQSAEPAKPTQPAQPGQTPKPTLEAPKPVEETKPEGLENTIEEIQFRGARSFQQDFMRAQMVTKKGDKFDAESLRGDFMALWNTARFDDITLETAH